MKKVEILKDLKFIAKAGETIEVSDQQARLWVSTETCKVIKEETTMVTSKRKKGFKPVIETRNVSED